MACTAHDTMHKQVNKMSYALFQGSGVHEHDLPGRAFEQRQLFAVPLFDVVPFFVPLNAEPRKHN
jgi:hypothetical protein